MTAEQFVVMIYSICVAVTIYSLLRLWRIMVVHKVRMGLLQSSQGYRGVERYRMLPEYEVMVGSVVYWHLWTPGQWKRWIDRNIPA